MPAVSRTFDEWFPTTASVTVRRLGWRPMNQPTAGASELDAVLHRVAGGSLADFAMLYDRTAARVYGLVLRVLRDTGYSEETTQEVYLEVWRNAGKYDPTKGSALAWLLAMAHRRAVDRVRAERAAGQRESRYGAASADPPGDVVVDAVIVSDEQRRVVDCLGGLPEKQRQCVELAYYGGLTYGEVSQRLAVNPSTIKTRMQEALRRLRECLGMP
ncbi:ECF RNA polymerase sigma factor SigK [Mycolicibacter hiberniae]|uniref:ECF RNA polymerase sigma factor SigK n=2 Tax=Mycolicibacter hiberniae TaxID=29314 RepID=A0A7I7WZF2_9MYCO|nr:ECF RNA polymerase sigma factor SigK [Mycolicibacter hiberniae]